MSTIRRKGGGLEWFVRRGNSVRGPLSSARIRHHVRDGELQLEDEVSTDRKAWRSLGSVDEVVPPQMRGGEKPPEAPLGTARAGERRQASRAIIVTVVLMAGLVLGVSLVGQRGAEETRDCAAPAAPGVLLEGCRLVGVDMGAAALVGARLANASLARARLAEADLSDADLRYVDLSEADLSYAKLSGAVLKGANLQQADLTNADLSGADLSFADLGGARLGGARLQKALLAGAIWTDGRPCGAADCPR